VSCHSVYLLPFCPWIFLWRREAILSRRRVAALGIRRTAIGRSVYTKFFWARVGQTLNEKSWRWSKGGAVWFVGVRLAKQVMMALLLLDNNHVRISSIFRKRYDVLCPSICTTYGPISLNDLCMFVEQGPANTSLELPLKFMDAATKN
jgi:hypothetical protein